MAQFCLSDETLFYVQSSDGRMRVCMLLGDRTSLICFLYRHMDFLSDVTVLTAMENPTDRE